MHPTAAKLSAFAFSSSSTSASCFRSAAASSADRAFTRTSATGNRTFSCAFARAARPSELTRLTSCVSSFSDASIAVEDARHGTIQVDVLKVPHHASENNVDSAFCDAVIAKHYVFCGNGEHANPDPRVVEMMARRRLTAQGSFKFWFNSSSAVVTKVDPSKHMAKVEKLVKALAAASNGRMTFKFLDQSSFKVL